MYIFTIIKEMHLISNLTTVINNFRTAAIYMRITKPKVNIETVRSILFLFYCLDNNEICKFIKYYM